MLKVIRNTAAAISSGASYLMIVGSVHAQDLITAPSGSVRSNTTLEAVPQFIVNGLMSIGALLSVIFLMWGGIRWITSRGDRAAVESAKKTVTYAIIGLVVVAGAFFIVNNVFQLLGAANPLQSGFKPLGS